MISNPKLSAKNLQLLFGVGIFLLGLVIRLAGIGWGMPNSTRMESLHPDEPIIQMYAQSLDPLAGKLDPGFYNYGTLYLTVARLLGGVVQSPEDYSHALFVGRLVNVFAGAGIAWMVFAILSRRTNRLGAVFGGLACAFAPGLVVHSRFATVDVFATFLVTCSLYFALQMWPVAEARGDSAEGAALSESGGDAGATLTALLAGAFAGLAGGTKYNFILVFLVALWGCLQVAKMDRIKTAGLSFLACIVAFVIATPGVVLNPAKFRTDLAYELRHTGEGHGNVFTGTPSGFVYQVFNLVEGFGPLLLIFGVLGLGIAAYRGRGKPMNWVVPLIAFALLYYFLIGRAEVKFLRYTFALIPVLAIGFGWVMGESHAEGGAWSKVRVALGILALGGFGGGGLSRTGIYTLWMSNPDPRDAAGAWLRREGQGKSVGLATDPWFYTPTLYPAAQVSRPQYYQRDGDGIFGDVKRLEAKDPRVVRFLQEGEKRAVDFDMGLLTTTKPDFIALSSFEFDDYERLILLGDKGLLSACKNYIPFIAALEKDYEQVKAFGVGGPMIHDLMYVQPRIVVYQRKP
ncbi:MAG: phospholipid carrier-dependent glycosyltransferase [Armatimonadetes bacterium]|nr:phospholipid carrier-dependent glycosyltransferase [Armatimonadota bacterium]